MHFFSGGSLFQTLAPDPPKARTPNLVFGLHLGHIRITIADGADLRVYVTLLTLISVLKVSFTFKLVPNEDVL